MQMRLMPAAFLVSCAGLIGLAALAVPGQADPTRADRAAKKQAKQDGGIAGTTIDISIARLEGLAQINRSGAYPATVGLAFSTTACNVGDVWVEWEAPMDERHPVIAQNFYRINGAGRLEQLGAAWLKHGWYAAEAPGCDIQCQYANRNGDRLGVGCSDTYSSGNNSAAFYLGPRHEVNPLEARWTAFGSFFDAPNGEQPDGQRSYFGQGAAPTARLMEVADTDLEQPGSRFFYEGYYVVQNDQNLANNIAWREVRPSRNNNTWNFTNLTNRNEGPLIASWGDQTNIAQPTVDGMVYVGSRVVDLGNGFYRYEYAMTNFNHHPEIRSITIPLPASAQLLDIGWHEPRKDTPNHCSCRWFHERLGNTVRFGVQPIEDDPDANSLRWGFTYTLWFTTDVPPSDDGVGTLAVHRPNLAQAPTLTVGLSAPRHPADLNGDGVRDGADFLLFLSLFFGDNNYDYNGDGSRDGGDFLNFLADFFA